MELLKIIHSSKFQWKTPSQKDWYLTAEKCWLLMDSSKIEWMESFFCNDKGREEGKINNVNLLVELHCTQLGCLGQSFWANILVSKEGATSFFVITPRWSGGGRGFRIEKQEDRQII